MENVKQQPIGVFDSGIGGLTAMKELLRLLPKEDIVYFGDTARVPYGSRDKSAIVEYARQDLRFLLSKKVKAVLVACGTVSSTAMPQLREMTDIPIVGVIEPAAQKAVEQTKNDRIAVLATQATVNSHAYRDAIERYGREAGKQFSIMELPCHLFVPLVENGFTDKDHPIVKAVVGEYIQHVLRFEADTIILGCTHYPLLKEAIQSFVPGAHIVESGKEAARKMAELLTPELLNTEGGSRSYFVSEQTGTFMETCELFVGESMKSLPQIVDLSKY